MSVPLRPSGPAAGSSVARPLVVSRRDDLIDDLLRLAAASGVEVEVAPDAVGARASWSGAPLVLVDDDVVRSDGVARLPHRGDVVLIGRDPDDGTVWRRAVELGADHVVQLPDGEPWLVEILAAARDGGLPPGAVVGVVGGRGGAGATTFAASLAGAAVARRWRTMLVDLDPLGGGIDLVLGCEGERGLRWPDLAHARGRIDGPSLAEALPTVGELSVLSWDRGADVEVPLEAARTVLEAAARVSDLVVVDLPRHGGPAALHAAARAVEVLLVVPADVRGVASAERVLRTYRPTAQSVRAVVRDPGVLGLSSTAVCEALSVDVAGELVSEPRAVRAGGRGESVGRRRRGPTAALCAQVLDDLAAVVPQAGAGR